MSPIAALMAALLSGAPAPPHALRVCADPNNLPFSNRAQAGFENKLAELIARELGVETTYVWFPQRRGFLRNTLLAGKCDVVMGVPVGLGLVSTTHPYYRSSFVFVSAEKTLPITSLDDPRLRELRIGIPLVGQDGENPPPLQALALRHLDRNARGFLVTGDYRTDSPPADLIRAVSRGEVDLAIAWGPLAGYYAARMVPPLRVVPVPLSEAPPGQPFAFEIALAVRPADQALRDQLDAILERRKSEIHSLLDSYEVPRLSRP